LFPKEYQASPQRASGPFRSISCRLDTVRILAAGLLSNVLILAREEVVAALLGLMVELRGMEPRFLAEGESVADALDRDRIPVLIDCDHADCTAETIELVRKRGGEPILFSPFRMQTDVTRLASRYRTRSFTLPTDPDTFGQLLKS
jgi:hypothetical protein